MTSADIYPLAQDLYAVIPPELRAWRMTTVQSSPQQTLLGKSRRSTSNVTGVRATRELDRSLGPSNTVYEPISPRIFELTNRVNTSFTPVRR
jgi:hypothetical protein